MAQTVVGFFDDAQDARRAVEQLVSNGFDRSRIDVSSGNSSTGLGTASTSTDRGGDHENGITRFFKNLFGDNDDEADRYSRVGMSSNSIVTVHAQSADEAERAADLLDDYGAINVNERASQYGTSGATSTSGMASMASNTPDYDRSLDSDRSSDYDNTRLASDSDRDRGGLFGNTGTTRDSDENATVQRVEENLEVGKRTVESGGVRVRSRIVERPVEENIRLREEHVSVERTPVDRPLGRNEMANFEEREIELTERSEVPVVNKEARVVEEIRVSKDVEERQETIRDSVRSTEVDIENLGDTDRRNVSGSGNYTDNTTGNLNRDTDFDDDDLTTRNSRI